MKTRVEELVEEAVRRTLEQAANIAMGHTGPGNTFEQSSGYSAACREIAETLRTVARNHPRPQYALHLIDQAVEGSTNGLRSA